MKDQLNVSSASKISMLIANLAMVISLVATVVLMYSSMTQRITSLETSRELMLNDLLKASDQKPIDQEQFLIQESLSADLEKLITRVDEMIHNGVNISRMMKDIDRLREDVEQLKNKVRENGNSYSTSHVPRRSASFERTLAHAFVKRMSFKKKNCN